MYNAIRFSNFMEINGLSEALLTFQDHILWINEEDPKYTGVLVVFKDKSLVHLLRDGSYSALSTDDDDQEKIAFLSSVNETNPNALKAFFDFTTEYYECTSA